MGKYNIGEVWWVHFPFKDSDQMKRRPAIVIDDDTIAILALYVTSQNKNHPYSIEIEDWKEAGLPKQSWSRIDRIITISEWYMDKKCGNLSSKDLGKILQLVKEINSGKLHEFSIIAIKNCDGKYLQKYDARWNCWLFPYIRSTDDNKKNVDEYISKLFQKDIVSNYVALTQHCKYSESDKVYKIYNHKLYEVKLDKLSDYQSENEFYIQESKYCWMSLDEMENDDAIKEKNQDVILFVKSKCELEIKNKN